MFEPSSQGLCKASARVPSQCSNLLLKGSARFVSLNLICSLLCLCDPLRKSFSKAHFPLFKPSSQGLCKASRLHSPWSILLLKGSARIQQGFTLIVRSNPLVKGSAMFACLNLICALLQQGFTLFVQTFLSRALQGLYA